MSATYSGSCACGAVRYQATADPLMAVLCQCRDCQRASGAGHAAGITFPKAAVELTGEVTFHAPWPTT